MRLTLSLLLAAVSGVMAPSLQAQSSLERGKALYELRCGECHDTRLHMRSRPVARDYEDVRAWVTHWSTVLGYQWEKADVTEVARYLNAKFYNYPCYGDDC